MGRKPKLNKKARFNLSIDAVVLQDLKDRYERPSQIIEKLAREHVEKLKNDENDGKSC